MLKFFRKIRHKLLSENRFTKYLIYSAGEILLVMIGILLALQVNNWNEDRKEKEVELNILYGLSQDLQKDIDHFRYSMIPFDSTVNADNKILIDHFIEPNSQYDISLDPLLGKINRYAFFYPQRMAYESLKTKGLETLKNESLRSKIVNLYDYEYDIISLFIRLKENLYHNSNEIFLNNLMTTGNLVTIKKPNNYQLLKENKVFINHLTHIYAEQKNAIRTYRNTLESVESIRKDVEKEIENKLK